MMSSSSGLLLYAALVDLLAEDFLSEEANRTLTGKDKKWAFAWVILGGKINDEPAWWESGSADIFTSSYRHVDCWCLCIINTSKREEQYTQAAANVHPL